LIWGIMEQNSLPFHTYTLSLSLSLSHTHTHTHTHTLTHTHKHFYVHFLSADNFWTIILRFHFHTLQFLSLFCKSRFLIFFCFGNFFYDVKLVRYQFKSIESPTWLLYWLKYINIKQFNPSILLWTFPIYQIAKH